MNCVHNKNHRNCTECQANAMNDTLMGIDLTIDTGGEAVPAESDDNYYDVVAFMPDGTPVSAEDLALLLDEAVGLLMQLDLLAMPVATADSIRDFLDALKVPHA